MKRPLALVLVLVLCGVAFAAGWLEVKPDKENVVASRLVGKWTVDVPLTKRLQGKDRAGLSIEFTSSPAAIASASGRKTSLHVLPK